MVGYQKKKKSYPGTNSRQQLVFTFEAHDIGSAYFPARRARMYVGNVVGAKAYRYQVFTHGGQSWTWIHLCMQNNGLAASNYMELELDTVDLH